MRCNSVAGMGRLLVAGVFLAFGACSERNEPAPLEPPPPAVQPDGMLRGTVDVVAGTLTFEPAVQFSLRRAREGISAAVYGNQGSTVQLYNSAVSIAPGGPGKKSYAATVGLRNLLSHSIGDEQSGVPRDTMGIFVFFTTEPVVTATSPSCPSCAVVVQNHHGTLTFTAASQKYFHWPERLAAAGQPGDTTRSRRSWSFLADSAVTQFQFEVLVAAAWPAPVETQWKIEYGGDSLPEFGTEPLWLKDTSSTNSGTVSAALGALTISTRPNNEIGYSRRDSLAATSNVYVQARILASATNSGLAETRLSINDGVRVVALGIASDRVGFIDNNNMFFGTPSFLTTTVYREYRISMYGSDSAAFFVDGVRRDAVPYGSFSPNAVGTAAPRIRFATKAVQGSSKADFDYVIYEIGKTRP